MNAPTFAALLLAVAAAQLTGCHRQPITAARLAYETNQRVTLPLDLGDGLRLDAITAEGNAVVSTVTLTDDALAADPRFREVMRNATQSDICREVAPARASYVDAGITVAKVYRDTQGTLILRVDVNPGDCG